MTPLIVEPFIDTLKLIESKGADPHAQVQKLKRFRDLEDSLKKLREEHANETEIENIRAKKREEVLRERQAEKMKANHRAPGRGRGKGNKY